MTNTKDPLKSVCVYVSFPFQLTFSFFFFAAYELQFLLQPVECSIEMCLH